MNYIDRLLANKTLQITIACIIIALYLIFSSIFVVEEKKSAIILQFGRPIKVITNPGIKIKIPLLQNIVFVDNRILDLSLSEQEIIASDQKRLIVNAFTKYKIVDPLKFYTSVYNIKGLESRLTGIFDSALRQIVGGVPLNKLLTDDRRNVMLKIQNEITDQSKVFGIEIVDTRIMRGDLPKENNDSIFARMQTEREKEAREIRAKGAEEAQKVKAESDKQKTIILAEARKKANIIRGVGDAESTRIYANAFGKDREFAEFYRSMKAYKESLKPNNTKFITSTDSQFFKQLNPISTSEYE